MFTLAISCLTTFNLPWFVDLTFQIPMQYCSLQLRTLPSLPDASTTGHCFRFRSTSSFLMELFLSSSPVAKGKYLFAFSPVHGVLKAKMLKWFAILFSSGPRFVRTLHHDPSVLGGPTWHGSSCRWVRQGCDPCHQFGYISVIVVFILSALWCMRIRDLWTLPLGGTSKSE